VFTLNTAPTPVNLSNTHPLWVGASDFQNNTNNSPWYGYLDEVEVFNRALQANELASIYDAGTNGKCKPCCYLWTPPILTFNSTGTPPNLGMEIKWTGCGNLYSSPNANGPWIYVTSVSPYINYNLNATKMFYVVKCN